MTPGRERLPDLGWQVRILYRTPNVLLEEPFEAFVSVLCFMSGIPLVLGIVDAQSVEATLPHPLVAAWGVTLLVGSAATLAGLRLTHGTTNFHRVMTGRNLERFGLQCLTYAAALYAACIFVFIGKDGAVNGGILIAFALTCAAKVLVLSAGTRLLHKALIASVEAYDADK